MAISLVIVFDKPAMPALVFWFFLEQNSFSASKEPIARLLEAMTPWTYVMAANNRLKNGISEALHTSATMRDFNARHLVVPGRIEPAPVKQIREANNVRKPVFARYLNSSENTVEKWETGAKRPSGMALKRLAVIQRHGLQVLA